jgi:hydroxyacylglutathione hydrolase
VQGPTVARNRDIALASVKSFFGLTQWPQGVASLDLGSRVVDVIPAPGHQSCELVFYDRDSALLFSGDFLIAGRLPIEDKHAFLESALRIGRQAK